MIDSRDLDRKHADRIALHDAICNCGACIGRDCCTWPEFVNAQIEDGILVLDGCEVMLPKDVP